MRMTSYFRSLVKSGTLDSSKSFALLLSVIIGAIIGLVVCFCLIWDVVTNGYIKTNLNELGVFLLCAGGFMVGGGINKVFGEKYFKHQKPEKNEKKSVCFLRKFSCRTLTQLVRGYEGRTNPVQLRRFMNDELSLEVDSIIGWSIYEDDDEVVLSPDEALDLHECIQELEEADIRYNVNGQSIENGAIRLSYNIYQQNILVSKVWLNKIESKELVNLIQRHFDNQ